MSPFFFNYHKLTHKALESLTYSYLQDWISAQSAAAKDGKPGADLRLQAAQELQEKLNLILAGEPPYDIFVRWKPLHEQAIGWNPDLNDGVRMNIRPFMAAGVLRKNPNIKRTKDRGAEPARNRDDYPWFWKDGTFTGDRVNDVHLTDAEKRAARERPRAKKHRGHINAQTVEWVERVKWSDETRGHHGPGGRKMHRLVVQSRVGSDGILHIDIPLGKEDADREVQVTIDPVRRVSSSMTQDEWRQFVMETAGRITDPTFVRHEQGTFKQWDAFSLVIQGARS